MTDHLWQILVLRCFTDDFADGKPCFGFGVFLSFFVWHALPCWQIEFAQDTIDIHGFFPKTSLSVVQGKKSRKKTQDMTQAGCWAWRGRASKGKLN